MTRLGAVVLEIIVGIIVLVIAYGVLHNLFSSSETKLFRRVWSSEKYSNYEARSKAINDLMRLFNVEISSQVEGEAKRKLEENIQNLIGKAIEFDVKYPKNLGIRIVPVLVRHLRMALSAAGINDFERMLNLAGGIDYAEMARAIEKTLSEVDLQKMSEGAEAALKREAELLTRRYELIKTIWANHEAADVDGVSNAVEDLAQAFDMELTANTGGLEEKLMDVTKLAAVFDVRNDNSGDARLVAVVAATLKSKLNEAGIADFDEQLNRIEELDWDTLVSLVG